jgi:predicted DNA binding protein
MFEVDFKMQHNCPYTRFSMKHPEVRLVEWCNNNIHVSEIDCADIETYTRVEPDLKELLLWKGGRIIKKNFLEGNLQLIVRTCICRKIPQNVVDVVEKNACFAVPPDVYYGGWEEYRVIGFREKDYKRMFEELSRLGPVEILRKRIVPNRSIRDVFAISLGSVFSELTDRQVDSLLAALESGYYQIPKKVTAEEIAMKHNVPRTTFEEHLRKAESKTLLAMAPYLRMYAARSKKIAQPLQIPA